MDELILQGNQDVSHPVFGLAKIAFLDGIGKVVNPLDLTHLNLNSLLLTTIEAVPDSSNIVPETLSWDHIFGWQSSTTNILQQDIYPTLQQFAQSPDFQSQIHSIFGDNLNAGKLNEIASEWIVGNFSLLPQIEVLDASVFSREALGAFAGETNKIYLSKKLLSSGSIGLIKETVIEEVGHFLDKQINAVDTPGDEGQLFAAVVTGKQLNTNQIAEIKTEDDTTTIFADGRFLTVEQATSTVTITAAPTVTIAVSDATAAETIAGQTANPGKFTLKRTGDLTSTLAVNYTVAGTATNGTDYNQLTGTATFGASASTTTIDLTVINDAILEPAETVIVTLKSGNSYNLGTTTTATVNIADNDKPTITIKATDATAAETVTGQTTNPGRFTLTRTGDLSSSPTVYYTFTGTATNGIDYNQLNGNVTFASGSSTAIIDLTVINDAVLEAQETVIVTLASSDNYTLGTAKTATVNIADNDKPTITIKATDASAAETITGQTTNPGRFTLTRTGDLSSLSTVYYTVTGTATNGTDYNTLTKNVTFEAGSATAIVDVNVKDDDVYEGNETVIVTLANNANYTLGTAKTATVSLVDNDKPTITIKASDANAAETAAGQTANPGKFTLTRTGNKTAALTVNYTVAGTATNGTDYNTLTKSVTFEAGSATAIIDVTPIDDFVYEGNETVILTLANKASYIVGTANTATVNLADNDSATTVKPTVTISANDATATETVTGQTANLGQFKLTRTGDLSSSLTVNYSVAGTASNSADYNNLSGTVTFAAGSSTAIINVAPIDDTAVEGDETVIVNLSSSTNYNLGTAKAATVNIFDNDYTNDSLNNAQSIVADYSQINNFVSNLNLNDFYRFTVSQSGIFTANLTGLTGDADVRLIQDKNNNGLIDTAQLYNPTTSILDPGEILAWQWERGTASESIRRFLNAGTYYLQVMSYNNQTANYNLATNFTPAASDDRKFSIQLNFGSSINSTAQATIRKAADFWENTISHSSFTGSQTLTINLSLDSSLSGYSGTGEITNTGLDANGRYMPISGAVKLSADVVNKLNSNSGDNTGILIHEMGHVLGLISGSAVNTSNGTYNANTYAGWAYGELKGTFTQTSVPMTTGVGSGSDYTHWKETVFGNEIMTHILMGATESLSQLSLAVLRDIGWNVNYGAAQPYTLPSLGGTGNTLNSVSANTVNVAVGSTYSYYFNNSVNSEFPVQMYRVNFAGTGAIKVTLNGLTADANMRLIYDANNNGLIDTGEVIATAINTGTTSESFNFHNLAAGNYYVDVYATNYIDSDGNRINISTGYALNFTSLAASEPEIVNNLNPVTYSYNLGKGNYITPWNAYSYSLSDSNIDELFKFNLGGTTAASFNLVGLTDNADMRLIYDSNNNGVIDTGEVIATSTNLGSASEKINLSGLLPGTYYLHVYRVANTNTGYILRLDNLVIT